MNLSSTLDLQPRFKQAKRGVNTILTAKDKIRGKARHTNTMAEAAAVDENKPLTAQQHAFATYWARGESISSAVQRAGYNTGDSYGYRMAKMPNVLKVYHREKVLYEAAAQMSRQQVMEGLKEAIDMARLMSEPASMIAGWREVGKMCGYYEPIKHTLDVTVRGEVTVRQLNAMTDAELIKLISGDEPMRLPDLTAPAHGDEEAE